MAHIKGLNIYYRTSGSGDRVVMTHGAWTDAETWQAVTPFLEDRHEVVVWDRRGHSRSQDGDGPGSYRQDADDLIGLIEHVGEGPVHLVGNSSGGAVVLDAVAARPDLVRSASVHEPAAFALLAGVDDELLSATRAGDSRLRELIEAGQHEEAARYFVDEMDVGLPAWDELPAAVQDVLIRNASTVIEDIEEPYRLESIDWDGLSRAGTPLLVTFGTHSAPILRESTRLIQEWVRCRLVEMNGVGHVPHRTHPGTYAELVGAFFSGSVPVR